MAQCPIGAPLKAGQTRSTPEGVGGFRIWERVTFGRQPNILLTAEYDPVQNPEFRIGTRSQGAKCF